MQCKECVSWANNMCTFHQGLRHENDCCDDFCAADEENVRPILKCDVCGKKAFNGDLPRDEEGIIKAYAWYCTELHEFCEDCVEKRWGEVVRLSRRENLQLSIFMNENCKKFFEKIGLNS